ncbi:MAG: RimK/LysX family protein [Candidatus Saccharimonadales bacterium]|jgi:hypothetical protein
MKERQEQLTVIGRTAKALFPSDGMRQVPVKIDTGADSSSIWASELSIDKDHYLHFVLFAKGSPYYTGVQHRTKSFTVNLVRSSSGHRQVRYRVRLPIVIAGRRLRGSFTLADRSLNTYPVLIGCTLLNKKFLVDVSKGVISREKPTALNDELSRDPEAFFEKYHATNERGDISL